MPTFKEKLERAKAEGEEKIANSRKPFVVESTTSEEVVATPVAKREKPTKPKKVAAKKKEPVAKAKAEKKEPKSKTKKSK